MKETGKTETAVRVAYSVQETAVACGKTTNAVYLAIQAGRIPTARMGDRHLIPVSFFIENSLSLPAADKDNS